MRRVYKPPNPGKKLEDFANHSTVIKYLACKRHVQ
jgi:hypothetical protein